MLVLCLDVSVCVLSEEEEELGDKRSRLWGRSADEELFMVNREYVIFLSRFLCLSFFLSPTSPCFAPK